MEHTVMCQLQLPHQCQLCCKRLLPSTCCTICCCSPTLTGKKRGRAPVWEDPADADISIQVAAAPRLRKLRQAKGQTEMTGSEYEAALRRQHCALHSRTSWAMSRRQQQQKGKAAGAAAEVDEQQEPDEATAERLLRSGSSLLFSKAAGAAGSGRLLAPGSLELSRLRDANGASPSDAVVQSVQFHPNGQLMLTAGFDKRLKLFQVRQQQAVQTGCGVVVQCCLAAPEVLCCIQPCSMI